MAERESKPVTVSVRINGLPPAMRNLYRQLRREKGYTRVEAQVLLLTVMVGLAEEITMDAPARRPL